MKKHPQLDASFFILGCKLQEGFRFLHILGAQMKHYH